MSGSGMAIFGFVGAAVCVVGAIQSRRDLIRCGGCILIGLIMLGLGMTGIGLSRLEP